MHPARAIPPVARGLLLATTVAWVALELRQSVNRRSEGVSADRGSRFVLRAATTAGVFTAIAIGRAGGGPDIPGALAAWLGLGIFWCGVALRLWSFRTLGRYFTFTVQTSTDQPVIEEGPYRFIRHPGYAGMLLAVIGLGLYIRNYWSLLVITAGVGCGLLYRIQVEERALLRDLGDKYRDYADTHKRMVPFIW